MAGGREMMDEDLQLTIKTYDEIAEDYVSLTSAMRPQPEFETFCGHLKSGDTVLDLGCAWGRDTNVCTEKGLKAIGMDLSINMLWIAKSLRRSGKFVQADLRMLPIQNNLVDGIWCVAALLHLKRTEIVRAFCEFRRVLKHGGVCYVQVKQGIGEETVTNNFSKGKERFFTYFEEEEIQNYSQMARMEIVDLHVYNERDRYGPNSRDQLQLCLLLQRGTK